MRRADKIVSRPRPGTRGKAKKLRRFGVAKRIGVGLELVLVLVRVVFLGGLERLNIGLAGLPKPATGLNSRRCYSS